jgi:alkanesulfonate monooxygenase SsuD/methylene tetrahydromethanopterin reductase-like flavin-dependent oxidoreductase (luciferase family)
MTTLGAIFRPDLPPERLHAVARAADEAGLDELWLWEDCFKEGGVAAAAAALAWTDRVRIGIGVFPVPLRNVALAAMEIASLDRLFPGRFIVGVGHGVQEWMAQVGMGVDSPLTLLREYLTALRALLRGEQVSTDGRYVRLDAVALDWPPETAPAILAGAVGPRTLQLSGQHADGTILTAATSPDRLRLARIHIDEGRAAAARTDPHPVVVYLQVATGPNAAQRLAAEQRRSGSDPSEEVGVAGDAGAVVDAARRLETAGADSVVLQPTADEADPVGFVRFVGSEIRPLLH